MSKKSSGINAATTAPFAMGNGSVPANKIEKIEEPLSESVVNKKPIELVLQNEDVCGVVEEDQGIKSEDFLGVTETDLRLHSIDEAYDQFRRESSLDNLEKFVDLLKKEDLAFVESVDEIHQMRCSAHRFIWLNKIDKKSFDKMNYLVAAESVCSGAGILPKVEVDHIIISASKKRSHPLGEQIYFIYLIRLLNALFIYQSNRPNSKTNYVTMCEEFATFEKLDLLKNKTIRLINFSNIFRINWLNANLMVESMYPNKMYDYMYPMLFAVESKINMTHDTSTFDPCVVDGSMRVVKCPDEGEKEVSCQ